MKFAIIDTDKSMWDKGWDIRRRKEGIYAITSDMVRELRGFDYLPYVWECRPGSMNVHLALEDEKSEQQNFSLHACGRYRIVGIRFARTMEKLYSLLHTSNPYLEVEESPYDERYILGKENTPVLIEEQSFFVTKSFTNTSTSEVPYDMYFDETKEVRSSFAPIHTINFNIENENVSESFIPFVRNDTLVTDIGLNDQDLSLTFHTKKDKAYKKEIKLRGVLNLLVRPRSTVTISYKYTAYRASAYYVMFLQDTKNPNSICKIGGYWNGTIYAESMKNKHKFSSKSLDKVVTDTGDEDVDFEATEEEASERSSSRTHSLRSIRSKINVSTKYNKKRIRI